MLKIATIIFIIMLSISCEDNSITPEKEDRLVDIDANIYQTIKIGEQIWMAENLKVTHFQNGEPIPNVVDHLEWENLESPGYCSYLNTDSNIVTYGLLYNYYAIADNRKLAPKGWHIPTDEEWKQLELYLGMSIEGLDSTGRRGIGFGGKLKESGTEHWANPNKDATNETGFTALPGGARIGKNGGFLYKSASGFWGSSTEWQGGDFGYFRQLEYSTSGIIRNGLLKKYGVSIRCIKD